MKVIIKRILMMIPLLIIITFLAFTLVRLAPGGPFAGEKSDKNDTIRKALEAHYHLDKPVWIQYGHFLKDLTQGNLGLSMKYRNHTVNDIVSQALPASLILGFSSFIFALVAGITMGIISAWKRGSISGELVTLSGLIFICVPSMVLGPILILFFSIYLPVFPTSFLHSPWHAVLPVLTLGIHYSGKVSRLVAEGIQEALGSDYIRTARAKGVGPLTLLVRHALPMGLLPVVSYSGPLLADLLTGSFVVENLFQIPGMGTFLINSSLNRDHTMIVGIVLIYSFLIIFCNIVVDSLYSILDPRIKNQSRS